MSFFVFALIVIIIFYVGIQNVFETVGGWLEDLKKFLKGNNKKW